MATPDSFKGREEAREGGSKRGREGGRTDQIIQSKMSTTQGRPNAPTPEFNPFQPPNKTEQQRT